MPYNWHQHLQSNGGREGRRYSTVIAGGAQVFSKDELVRLFRSPTFNVQMAQSYLLAALENTKFEAEIESRLFGIADWLGLLLEGLACEGDLSTGAEQATGSPQGEGE